MAAMKVKVHFADGTDEVLRVSPMAQMNAEEAAGGFAKGAELSILYRFAYEALKLAGKTDCDFEIWASEKADWVDDVSDERPNPTRKAQPRAGSSNSASKRA